MQLRWIAGLTIAMGTIAAAGRQANPYLGAWNISGTGPDAANVYWLEIKDDGGRLSGLFLNQTGHALPLAVVKTENGDLVFQGGEPDKPNGPEYRAHMEGNKLVGSHTIMPRGRPGMATVQGGRVVNWVGVRPPVWPTANANGNHTYGTAVALFDGTTLDTFTGQRPSQPLGWSIVDGTMTNPTPPANNLVSKAKFTDFKVTAEFKVGTDSNSGLYLRGRYELQILDDLNDTKTEPFLTQMAIYGRTAPSVKASKAAGEWQTMEAILVANRVTVTLNGRRVQDNTAIIGITGGALDNDELAPGPIMIQGDHGQVWFRKVIVTPITK
jgi:hypothetical protein